MRDAPGAVTTCGNDCSLLSTPWELRRLRTTKRSHLLTQGVVTTLDVTATACGGGQNIKTVVVVKPCGGDAASSSRSPQAMKCHDQMVYQEGLLYTYSIAYILSPDTYRSLQRCMLGWVAFQSDLF